MLFECWFTMKPSFSIFNTNIFWKVLVTDKRIIQNICWPWHHRSIITFTTVTDRRTSRLLDRIGPVGRFDENNYTRFEISLDLYSMKRWKTDLRCFTLWPLNGRGSNQELTLISCLGFRCWYQTLRYGWKQETIAAAVSYQFNYSFLTDPV